MDDMIHHSRAARRGAPSRFIVGDLPFGSFENSVTDAIKNSVRFIKDVSFILQFLAILTKNIHRVK